VTGFFEPLPEPPKPERHRQPAWIGPPDNVLGAPVPMVVLLAKTEELAVVVAHPTAYPNGFELRLQVRARVEDFELDPVGYHPRGRGRGEDAFRFGLQFSDGRKATSVGRPLSGSDSEPEPPRLIMRGGGGGGGSWDHGWWVWGLPTPGPLAFVCTWPAKGLAETRVEVDAGPILEAAARAEELWPGGEPSRGSGGWTTYAGG
jgi:hypothetical protein